MLVFVDESGDAGFKIGRGSSTHFVVATVCFQDRRIADACDDAIGAFRTRIGLSDRFEFHFSQTRDDITLDLLREVSTFDFTFTACFIDKTSADQLAAQTSDNHLLSDLVGTALCLLPELREAIVVIDGQMPKAVQSRIGRRLKELNRKRNFCLIRKVKFRRSHGNNLLQMADAVSGAIFRSLTKHDDTFLHVIRRHERGIEQRNY